MADKSRTVPNIVLEVVLDAGNKTNKEKTFVTTRSHGNIVNKEGFASEEDIVQTIVNKTKELSALNNIPFGEIPVIVEGSKTNAVLRETLKEQGIKALQKSRKDKDYYYDHYYDEYVYYDPLTPYGVINFDDLEQAQAAQELNEDYLILFAQYAEMGKRIIDGSYYLDFGDERGKLSLMTELTQQFLTKLESVTAEKGTVRKEVKQKEAEQAVTEIVEQITETATEQLEEQPAELVAQNQGVSLFKNAKGEMIWAGVHSNKFMDRDGDILTEASHQRFVEKVYEGEYDFPELWVWHTPVAVGKAEWLAYDERGFLLSGGKVFKEFEELVTELVKNTPEMGMSHGMPEDTVIYDDENFIKEYQSIEVTMLPVEFASNVLTDFKVGKK